MSQEQIERQKYDIVWRDFPLYRDFSPGEGFAPFFYEGFYRELNPGQSILDFGCGCGRVAKEFMSWGLNVTLVDISPFALDEEVRTLLPLFSHQLRFVQACLWDLPEDLKPADWIYCCDVMEHIPENYVDEVLAAMAMRMKKGGYFSICLQEDLAGKQVGHKLHLTVQGRKFWEERVSKYFRIVGEDAIAGDIYFNFRVVPRYYEMRTTARPEN